MSSADKATTSKEIADEIFGELFGMLSRSSKLRRYEEISIPERKF
jgi:hypothetical protein